MPLTTSAAVRDLLGGDYDPCRSLDQFIATAGAVVARWTACALDRGVIITADEKSLVAAWLSAHFYQQSDPAYTSKSTGSASGSFARKVGDGLASTSYGQAALQLDPTGCLKTLGAQQTAMCYWGGTPTDQQTRVEDW